MYQSRQTCGALYYLPLCLVLLFTRTRMGVFAIASNDRLRRSLLLASFGLLKILQTLEMITGACYSLYTPCIIYTVISTPFYFVRQLLISFRNYLASSNATRQLIVSPKLESHRLTAWNEADRKKLNFSIQWSAANFLICRVCPIGRPIFGEKFSSLNQGQLMNVCQVS